MKFKAYTKRVVAVVLGVTMALSLAACGSKKEYSCGKWDGDTYKSSYAELQMTLPNSTWSKVSDADMGKYTSLTESEAKGLMEGTTSPEGYDMIPCFGIQSVEAVANIAVMYVNLESDTFNKFADSDDYINEMKNQISNQGYTVSETSTATYGGKSFSYLKSSVAVQTMTLSQDYYVCKYDDKLLCIIATYSNEGVNDVDTFMNSIAEYTE